MTTIIIGIIRTTRDTAALMAGGDLMPGVVGPTDGVALMAGDGEDIQVMVIRG